MISEDSASPFFAFSCGLAGLVLAHYPSRLKRWNVGTKSFFRVFMRPCGGGVGSSPVAAGTLECWQTQKAGSGFLGLLSCCVHLTHDFEGGGFFWG